MMSMVYYGYRFMVGLPQGWLAMGMVGLLWVYGWFTVGLWMVYYGYRFMDGLLWVYSCFTMAIGLWMVYHGFVDDLL